MPDGGRRVSESSRAPVMFLYRVNSSSTQCPGVWIQDGKVRGCCCPLKQNGRERQIRSRLRSAEVVDESCQEEPEEDVDVWYGFHDGDMDKKANR